MARDERKIKSFASIRQEAVKGGSEGPDTNEFMEETETSITYLGVKLEKAKKTGGAYVPKREQYEDFINDAQLSIPLQGDIAVAFLTGDPILVEGGTSLGKTTTVKKMAAELGWEVHYANLNGTTDVEDLMGKYIPNTQRKSQTDPEYVFADGKVTSGLRPEEGKTKIIILDEFNSATPNVLIRLHEVLDALERNGDVVLSEDASEVLSVNRGRTKIIALMNPPGKGYFGREPLDPAQLRRWVYKKLPSELPEGSFAHATDALFGMAGEQPPLPDEMFIKSREVPLLPEEVVEIPGIQEIVAKYKEFHKAAKQLLSTGKIATDQPQAFSFDDRMETRRVRDFLMNFYNGDINETFLKAIQYYYIDKLESEEDRQKLLELAKFVEYRPKTDSKRKGLEAPRPEKKPSAASKTEAKISEKEWPKEFDFFSGDRTIERDDRTEFRGLKVGQKVRIMKGVVAVDPVMKAKDLEIVGFRDNDSVIVQLDGDKVTHDRYSHHVRIFEPIVRGGDSGEPTAKKEWPRKFTGIDGVDIERDDSTEFRGARVGQKLELIGASVRREIKKAKDLEIVGFRDGKVIIQLDGDKVVLDDFDTYNYIFEPIEGDGTFETKKSFEKSGEAHDPKVFLNKVFDFIEQETGWHTRDIWTFKIDNRNGLVDMNCPQASEINDFFEDSDGTISTVFTSGATGQGIDSLIKLLEGKKVISVESNGGWFLKIVDDQAGMKITKSEKPSTPEVIKGRNARDYLNEIFESEGFNARSWEFGFSETDKLIDMKLGFRQNLGKDQSGSFGNIEKNGNGLEEMLKLIGDRKILSVNNGGKWFLKIVD